MSLSNMIEVTVKPPPVPMKAGSMAPPLEGKLMWINVDRIIRFEASSTGTDITVDEPDGSSSGFRQTRVISVVETPEELITKIRVQILLN